MVQRSDLAQVRLLLLSWFLTLKRKQFSFAVIVSRVDVLLMPLPACMLCVGANTSSLSLLSSSKGLSGMTKCASTISVDFRNRKNSKPMQLVCKSFVIRISSLVESHVSRLTSMQTGFR